MLEKLKSKLSRRSLTALLAVILLVCLGYIGWKTLDYSRGAKEYESAVKIVDIPPLEAPGAPEKQEPGWEIPEELLDILAQIDLDALKEANDQAVGWIVIPGTVVSYPILQGEDNRYYLNHTWTGVESSVGAIFMECKCAPDFSDYNTIIYGHRMRNGSMFGSLRSYNSLEYWKQHPVVYIITFDKVYAYDVFAAFETGLREIVYRLDIQAQEDKEALIAFSLGRSAIDTGVTPTAEDQVLTLSTCTGRGHATRWVVQAVLRAQADR